MAEYRRFISYIYLYEGDQKTENRGFVRVESRGNECRLHIHMTKQNDMSEDVYTVYMLYRENSGYIGIKTGQLNQDMSSTEWEFITDSEHLMGTDYKLDLISGMIILGDSGRLYGTRWDDEPLETGCFREEDRVSGNVVRFGFRSVKNGAETEQIVVTALDGQDEQIGTPCEQMMRRLPSMYPFEDDSVEGCVRVELQDISYLPINCWFYAGNSFLLHSYYCYRHLILARIRDGAYILGVPGIWQYRERYMASMFGFKHFKPVVESKTLENAFGYWYVELEDIAELIDS